MTDEQRSEGRERRRKEPPVGSGIKGRRYAGSQEEKGSDLTTNHRVLWFRVETLET